MISERVISVAKAAVYGYVLCALMAICAVGLIGSAVGVLGIDSLTLGLGPVPFMRAWSQQSGWGFESAWGIGVFGLVGTIMGLVLAWRRQAITAPGA
jgi:hypothetical protein